MARHKIKQADVWIEHGKNLLKHGLALETPQSHVDAMIQIDTILPKLKKAVNRQDEGAQEEYLQKLNSVLEHIDSEVWNNWLNRRRSKKSSAGSHRRDIPDAAYQYLKSKADEGGSVQKILAGLGSEYLITDNHLIDRLNELATKFLSDEATAFQLLNYIEGGFTKQHVVDKPTFAHWYRGGNISKDCTYKFSDPTYEKSTSKRATKIERIGRNTSTFLVKELNLKQDN
jgi:hypothetical protein